MSNRIFKFRVWNLETRQWDNTSLLTCNSAGKLEHSLGIANEKIVIQQYTSFLDRNGLNICEGDIIKIIYPIEDIVTCEYISSEVVENSLALNQGMFIFKSKKNDVYQLQTDHSYEVIGNIFENPELINV